MTRRSAARIAEIGASIRTRDGLRRAADRIEALARG